MQVQKYDDKVVDIGALAMNGSQTEAENSLLMSPFTYISKSDLSDIMGDIGMNDLFSPKSTSFKSSSDIVLFSKPRLPEDDKENVTSEKSRKESCE